MTTEQRNELVAILHEIIDQAPSNHAIMLVSGTEKDVNYWLVPADVGTPSEFLQRAEDACKHAALPNADR